MKICLIGNLNHFVPKSCGQVTKTQLYYKILKKEFYKIDYVDFASKFDILYFFLFKKMLIKKYDVIIVLSGPRACHYVLPLLVKANKRKSCRIIYSAIGVGYVAKTSDGTLDVNNIKQNVKKIDIYTFKNLDACLFESINIADLHKKYYLCKKFYIIPNFRDIKIYNHNRIFSRKKLPLKIIFLSRVCESKGVFDLIDVVNDINNVGKKIILDIYGNNELNKNQLRMFSDSLNNSICYRGQIDNKKINNLLFQYDVFCFPTKYYGEGMPGVIVEALMSGMPIISSDFFQVKYIIKNNVNGILFKLGDKNDLKGKILFLYRNREFLKLLSKEAYKTGEKYTYTYWRTKFLNIIKGK